MGNPMEYYGLWTPLTSSKSCRAPYHLSYPINGYYIWEASLSTSKPHVYPLEKPVVFVFLEEEAI